MADQPTTRSVRTWVLRDGGLPLEERTVELGLEPIIIDDTPDRQALFFVFDGPGILGLRAGHNREPRPSRCSCGGCHYRQRSDICLDRERRALVSVTTPRVPSCGRDAQARRPLPRIHRPAGAVPADGLRPQPSGQPLRRDSSMDRAVALAARRPMVPSRRSTALDIRIVKQPFATACKVGSSG